MFSAYTIRKVLPRLLIAAVAIQLSWSLCLLAININNNVAHGIEGLLYAPFGGQNNLTLENIVTQNGGSPIAFNAGVFTAVAAGTAGFFALGSGTVMGILALAGTAALGVLIAIFTLVLRRVVLIALVLVAPIAIVAWVLPGTERIWKLWWESFSKLLIMYPLILLLVAAGRIFAYASANTGNNEFLGFIMIILGFFGPLFLIPATLKLAGTAFTAISGAANNRSKGVFDQLRNKRAKEAEANRAKFFAGGKFNDRNKFTSAVNTIGRRAGLGYAGRFGYGERGAAAGETQSLLHAAEVEKTNAAFAANKEDEKVMKLLSVAHNRNDAQSWIKREAAAMRESGKSEEDVASFENNFGQALQTASLIGFNHNTRRAAMMSGGAISYGFKAGEEGWNEATTAMKELAGVAGATDEEAMQNQTYRNLMNQFQYNAKGMGRSDLAGGTDGEEYNGYRAWSSVGLYQHGNGKPADIKGASKYFQGLMGRAATGVIDEKSGIRKQDIKNFGGLSDAEMQAFEGGTMSAEDRDNVLRRTVEGAGKAAAVFSKEMGTVGSNASGAVRDEALAQRRALSEGATGAMIAAYESHPDVVAAVRGYDPTDRRSAGGEEAYTA